MARGGEARNRVAREAVCKIVWGQILEIRRSVDNKVFMLVRVSKT